MLVLANARRRALAPGSRRLARQPPRRLVGDASADDRGEILVAPP